MGLDILAVQGEDSILESPSHPVLSNHQRLDGVPGQSDKVVVSIRGIRLVGRVLDTPRPAGAVPCRLVERDGRWWTGEPVGKEVDVMVVRPLYEVRHKPLDG